jgi:hypothetical protein
MNGENRKLHDTKRNENEAHRHRNSYLFPLGCHSYNSADKCCYEHTPGLNALPKPTMDGPHIFGFSPAVLCINLTNALASARLVGSGRASMNAATLNLVGLVLFTAIAAASCSSRG